MNDAQILINSYLFKRHAITIDGEIRFWVGDEYNGPSKTRAEWVLRNPAPSARNRSSVFNFAGEQVLLIAENKLLFSRVFGVNNEGAFVTEKNPIVYWKIKNGEIFVSSSHKSDAVRAFILYTLCIDKEFSFLNKEELTEEDYFLASDIFYYKHCGSKGKEITIHTDCNLDKEGKIYTIPSLLSHFNQGIKELELELQNDAPNSNNESEENININQTSGISWNEIKTGALRNFNTSSNLKVPELDILEDYTPTEDYWFLVKHIKFRLEKIKARENSGMSGAKAIDNDAINFSLIGPPGTGKSVMIKAIAATFGLPFGISRNSSDTDIDEYEGKTRLINGSPEFCDVDCTEIAKNGGILANEEVNLTPSGVITGALNQFAEKPFILKRNGYENVERHPYTILCNLFNPTVRGGQIMNQSYISRFPITLDIQAPTDNEMASMLLSKFDGTDTRGKLEIPSWYNNTPRKITKNDAILANAILKESIKWLKACEAEELALTLSTRQCIAFLQLLEEGFPKDIAFKNTFCNAIKCVDIEQDRADSVSSQYENEFLSAIFPKFIWDSVK